MATNSKGHVFAFNTQRRDAAAFVKEFGVGSYRRESAVQLSPADRHRMGPTGQHFHLCGYGESRVVKYDKNGRFMKSVGTRGNGPLQFSTPHAIAVDGKGLVYVADRGNSRMVVLANDLNQKAVWDTIGAPWAVCISQGPHQYIYSSNSFPTGNNFDQASMTGEIYKMELDGRSWGASEKPGTAPRNSAPCIRWIAAMRTKCTWRKSRSGGFRRSRSIRRPRVRPVGDRRP